MSRIDELINKHCPDGVVYKGLQEIFETKNGYTPSKSNKIFWIDGTVPWFRMDDIRKNGTILSESLQQITKEAVKGGRLFPANSIIIATSATIGEHALITVPHLSNQRFTSLSLKPEFSTKLDMRFVYYYCFVLDNWCLANTEKSSFSSVNMVGFKRFKFPVPPLPVQQEIIDILDKFTMLEAELEAELEARQQQYTHYRDELLRFDGEGVKKIPLGDIYDFQYGTGNTIPKIGGEYSVYGSNGIVGSHNEYNSENSPVIGHIGAYAGIVNWGKGNIL